MSYVSVGEHVNPFLCEPFRKTSLSALACRLVLTTCCFVALHDETASVS